MSENSTGPSIPIEPEDGDSAQEAVGAGRARDAAEPTPVHSTTGDSSAAHGPHAEPHVAETVSPDAPTHAGPAVSATAGAANASRVDGFRAPDYISQPRGGSPDELVRDPQTLPRDGLGTAGFVVSLVGVFLPLFLGFIAGVVGIVLSSISMARHRPTLYRGRGLAIAGLVLGILAVIFIL